jgi:hypothetical protein
MIEEHTDSRVLFSEKGASWLWLLAGPLSAGAMLMIETRQGHGPNPWVPLIFLVLVTGFIALQIKAARIHASVELTATTLREGTEQLSVADIVSIYPPPVEPREPGEEPPKWMSARTLGELTTIPRGRKAIGLRLTDNRRAQAWARRHAKLRAALTELVEARIPPGTLS